MRRSTIVVSDRLAVRRVRDELARAKRLGTRVLTLSGVAARLAGGFGGVVPASHLKLALQQPPLEQLYGLADIAALPGFARAASATLRSVWNAGIDLTDEAAKQEHERWEELRALEEHVRATAPAGSRLLPELLAQATERAHLAPHLVGPLTLDLVDEVPRAYQRLLEAVSVHVPVQWWLASGSAPQWATATGIEVVVAEPTDPTLEFETCADPAHEALEALRWVRSQLVAGVPAEQIAMAAVDVGTYDETLHTLAQSSRLPIHFVHGVSLLGTAPGQFAAAMADAIMNGPTQARVRRVVDCATAAADEQLGALPPDWCAELAPDAALNSVGHWGRALEPLSVRSPAIAQVVLRLVQDLSLGPSNAVAVGEKWLSGTAQQAWRAALAEGPAAAVAGSLQRLRVSDDSDPATHVLWASASSLLTWPRSHVRLLGLSARAWPRRSGDEDPLLPKRVLGGHTLFERTTARRDSEHLQALLGSTSTTVVLSRPRRGRDGRKQSPSPLLRHLPGHEHETERLPRAGTEHALSEADRRTSRPEELAADEALHRAREAFRSYRQPWLTPHDGLVRAGHPVVARALARRHSATSLKKLLLNPHGFVATCALGWSEPQPEQDVLELDALSRGSLIHEVLEECLTQVQARGGFGAIDHAGVSSLVGAAVERLAVAWEMTRPVPPPLAWQAELQRAAKVALDMLTFDGEGGNTMRSYAEVRFGYAADGGAAPNGHPWRHGTEVTLPGTQLRLRGVIDRLDLDDDRKLVRVVDYKTGRQRNHDGRLDQGAELQRVLYTIAVKQLLGPEYTVEAGLLYAGTSELVKLADPDASVEQLTRSVQEAVRLLAQGLVLPGPAVTDDYEETQLAYPAVGTRLYYRTKQAELEARRSTLDALLAGSSEQAAGVSA